MCGVGRVQRDLSLGCDFLDASVEYVGRREKRKTRGIPDFRGPQGIWKRRQPGLHQGANASAWSQ